MTTTVEHRTVAPDDDEVRLDRWLRQHYPALPFGRLQKLLRTGQVRVDGRRGRGDLRLAAGQTVRVPPTGVAGPDERPAPRAASGADRDLIRSMVLHEDDALLVLDKPAGLAVQGGSGTRRHIDGMVAGLGQGGETPRLVHRLDRDTSGLLVLAKSRAAAAALSAAFRRHAVDKLYWAIVVGRPRPPAGRITARLSKGPAAGHETVRPDEAGQRAESDYRTIQHAGRIASWLGLRPRTGRTHQLRVHCQLLGTPILGDRKHGGPAAVLGGAPDGLMLHARELGLPHPDGGRLDLVAPPSNAFRAGLAWLGLEAEAASPGASLASFDER